METQNKYFNRGDLVEIDYGYSCRSVGVFMQYYGPHNGHWASRAWIFTDGESLPIPVDQIRLLRPIS